MIPRVLRTAVRFTAAAIAFAAAAYTSYVAVTWSSYGRPRPPDADSEDTLLDAFMPRYEVVERHHVRIPAPADVVLSAASEMNLEDTLVVRTIFRTREWILRAAPDKTVRPEGLLAKMKSLGWVELARVPGEVVVGAVTRPWDANPVFRSIPPEQFAAFNEPGYVKIVWTLRVDSYGPQDSIFRTETRAVATDMDARRRFRKYWAMLSPGIIVIRSAMVSSLRQEVERRTPPVMRSLAGASF